MDLEQRLIAAEEAVARLQRYVPRVVAEGVLHDQERLRGERREVAVLFADAVNFTRLSASLDAESIFGLINDLLGRLVTCVHRYDGVVDKFTGDGLMAVFGAPLAHENDPELAVRAALDMQRAAAEFEPIARAKLGAPLQIRIGVHAGPAVAGILGTQEQAAYTVIGQTVNLAARLESLAHPGRVLVSARVYQQTRALFDFQSMGTISVKGVDRPVGVYEAVGSRAEPLPTRGVAGVETVLLGRDEELSRLRVLLSALVGDGYGGLVVVEGEAGLGKSRLVAEWLSGLGHGEVVVRRGRGLPYTQGVGYGVFRSLLQDALQTVPAGEVWDRRVSAPLRPFLQHMLGRLSAEEEARLRNLEPERVKELTVLALREWILGEASEHPLVLVLDDFHWADDLSREALQSIVSIAHNAPVLFCVITRPRPEAPLELKAPPAAAPSALYLKLEPLLPEESRALLSHLVALEDLPQSIVDAILERAQGIPFYIEEFVRMLIEKGLVGLQDGRWHVVSTVGLEVEEVPTTLRGLMMARVDRLPEDMKNVLRDAAVIGLQFTAPLLTEVERRLHATADVSPLLQRLVDMGLLVERPEVGDQVYAFRHILTQETIYGSLMRRQLPDLHRTVAESIEAVYASDLEDQAEVLAFHYDRTSMRAKAMRYTLLSGERARSRFSNRQAIEYYSRALQLSQHLDGYRAERWQAAVGLGEVEQRIGEYEEAIAIYQAALEEWEEAAPAARARVMLRVVEVWDKRGDLEQAEDWLRRALIQLEHVGSGHPDLRATLYSELGWVALRRGDLASARDWLEHGLQLVDGTDHYDVLSSILNRLGAVYYHRSEWDQAAACVERALELREQLGDVVGLARSFNNLGILKKNACRWDEALATYQRSMEMMELIGDAEGIAIGHTNLGNVYIEIGEWEKAEENYLRSFVIARRIEHPYELAQAHMNLGRLYLLQGRWEECARHLDAAIPLYQEAGARANLNLNDAYELQGRLHLELGEVEAAEEWASRSYELLSEVTQIEESVEWGRYERLRGRIAQKKGDLEAARRHLDRSMAIFERSGPALEIGRAAYWSALLALEEGRAEEARRELTRARELFAQVGAAADLQRVEEAM